MKKTQITKQEPGLIKIAMVCHEANRAYCKSIGDNSQKAWNHSPNWQKQSAINGVQFHLEHPHSKPSDSHNSWLKEKQADGWKYGSRKNPTLKLHPCMVPYDKLPLEQRRKDALFIAVVRSMTEVPSE